MTSPSLTSVIDMMRGNLGQPPGGFPAWIVKKVLKGEHPISTRPGVTLPPVDFEATAPKSRDRLRACQIDDEDLNGYLMYPKVFLDYMGRHRTYGPVRSPADAHVLLRHGAAEEITAEIDPGKTLEIRLQAIGETTMMAR